MAATTVTQKIGPKYAGPAYPFGPIPSNVLGPKSDEEVIFSSLANIITTPKGSIPHSPKLGSEVPGLLFEPQDEVTNNLIRYFANKDITDQEPRANIHHVFTEVSNEHTILITIAFSITGDPGKRIFSAPFIFPRSV